MFEFRTPCFIVNAFDIKVENNLKGTERAEYLLRALQRSSFQS